MSEIRRLFIIAAAIVAPTICAGSSKPDIENGKAVFDAMCAVCHSVQETGGATVGPNLLGIVGRKAAIEPAFTMYSSALKASRITWSKKTLDKFLMNPNANVPGTVMQMLVADKKARADVVAYLATLKVKKKK